MSWFRNAHFLHYTKAHKADICSSQNSKLICLTLKAEPHTEETTVLAANQPVLTE